MTIDNVLEILEKHKLHIPSNVFYELKADIVNFEEPTTKNDLSSGLEKNSKKLEKDFGELDCISRTAVLKLVYDYKENHSENRNEYPINYGTLLDMIRWVRNLPSITPQELKCKNCKWWKDSDGEYRRGCGAESKCPINRKEVYEGNGYCYMYEPQESEE